MSRENRGHQRLEQFLENPRRALWVLSMPILFGMSIQTLYMIVDMVFVGQYSAHALTAVAFNLPLIFLAMGFTFGLGSAITALIAQAIGARDEEQSNAVASHSVVVGLCMTAFFVLAGLTTGPSLLHLLGVPQDLHVEAWAYLRIIVLGFPFMMTAVFLRSILSGEGNVKVPVMIQGSGTVLNIALDPLFIFTLDLGASGAALATLVSQAIVTSVFAYLIFLKSYSSSRIVLRGFRFEGHIVQALLKLGVPASLSFVVMAVGSGAFNRLLVEYTPAAVAAHQIGARLDHLVIIPLVSLGVGLMTLVGMFYGAGRLGAVERIVRYALVRASAIGLVFAVALYITAPTLVRIFTTDPEILRLSVSYVRTIVLAYPFFGLSMLTGRALQGLGQGTPELILSLLRVLILSVPLAFVSTIVLGWSVEWVWLSMVFSSITTACIAAVWIQRTLRSVHELPAPPASGLSASSPAT